MRQKIIISLDSKSTQRYIFVKTSDAKTSARAHTFFSSSSSTVSLDLRHQQTSVLSELYAGMPVIKKTGAQKFEKKID